MCCENTDVLAKPLTLPITPTVCVVLQHLKCLQLHKRICNLSTCLTHNLGEMLMNNVRGTPKTPMNVGPKSFGKRDIQPPGFLPF
uniref:Calcitonin peptide-like domain-containing protein n=1 Tax=Poecilia mexicana TaxID=48701 RepID=A0A3B3WMP8_9TELE